MIFLDEILLFILRNLFLIPIRLSWASNRLVARHLTIRLDAVLQTEKFPASIANLDSWRSVLIGTSWNVYQENRVQLPKTPLLYVLPGRASEKNKLLGIGFWWLASLSFMSSYCSLLCFASLCFLFCLTERLTAMMWMPQRCLYNPNHLSQEPHSQFLWILNRSWLKSLCLNVHPHIAIYWRINVEATPKRNTLLFDLCWF